MAQDIIPSVAILKVNWDEGHDYIDNFVPFVAECLRAAPQPEVSLEELQKSLANGFGFQVPQGALKSILSRAARRGLVKRVHGIYRRDDAALAALDGFSRNRATVLQRYEALVDKLADFSKNHFDVAWSREQVEAALLRYLQEGAAAVLAAVVAGDRMSAPAGSIRGYDFVVGSFVLELQQRDPEGFAFLETIVKGSMLAGVLLYPELAGVARRFDGVEVYFDTPFVLQALGYEGKPREAPRQELLRLLYEQNATLRIFQHTLIEVTSVLSAAASALRNYSGLKHAYGPTIQHLADAGYSASDVELEIARLEKSLRGIRIDVVDRPPHSEALTVDEERLEAILQECVGYARDDTLRHDLDSLTAIHRLRRGQFHLHVESCRAIFVTSNHNLYRASALFFAEQYDEYRGSVVPYSYLDHVFTTLVWLKKPLAATDLPVKQMIADCYVALNPTDRLWKRYLTEIERLRARGDITSEDYDLLRLSSVARNALMEATLGEADAFAEGTAAEILARAQAAARAETEAELQREKEARLAAERQAEEHLSQAAAQAAEALATEREARLTAERRLEVHRRQQVDRIRSFGVSLGRWIAATAMALMLCLIGFGTFVGLFLPSLPGGWLLPLFVAALASAGAAGVASVAFGANLNALRRSIEVATSDLVERVLKHLLGVE